MNDRRRYLRIKKAMDASIHLADGEFPAQTYDINQRGLSLFTTTDFPVAQQYQVHCQLTSGTSARFDVVERRRMVLEKNDHRFLRLGLEIVNESMEIVTFFGELAKIVQDVMFRDSGPINDDSVDLAEFDTLPGLESRGKDRLIFQLPAIAKIDGTAYKCRTSDISSNGLGLLVPGNFPVTNSFLLDCLDPDGGEVSVLVRERHREPFAGGDNDMCRVGVAVINETTDFQALVAKYAVNEKK